VWNKTTSILLVSLILIVAIAETQAVGSITLVAGTKIKTKYGQLTVLKNMVMASMAAYANGTIMFNVTAFELVQRIYQFNLQAYGNGTWNIRFWGIIPIQVTAANANGIAYSFPSEQISYTTSQLTVLTVVYASVYPTESQRVLFIDDFLYTNPFLESSWTIDRYTTNANTGISTSSGYLQIAAQSTSTITGVHVTQPAFNTSGYVPDGVQIKRKLTVSLIPYQKNETSITSTLHIGYSSLVTDANQFPGNGPYATPTASARNDDCTTLGNAVDNIGSAYFYLTNTGIIEADTCGNPAFSHHGLIPLGKINPVLYTVLTVETSAIFCSTCQNHVQNNTSWIFFRAYQRETSGSLIAGSDRNTNTTINIAPFFQTSYVMISQQNSNSAATAQISKIDLVQLQNYGSPVCLSVPGGVLCTRLPTIPSGLGQGLISDIAWLANQIGFGDEQIGAIIMFIVFSGGFSFIPFILTRNYLVGGTGLLLVFTFFIFAGFIPTWMLFIPILFGGVLGVLLVNRLLGSHSLMGGGSSDG